MQTDIDPLVVVHVNGNVLSGTQSCSVSRLKSFEVSPHHVIALACWETLCELAPMIGGQLPAHFLGFILRAADFYLNAIYGTIVGPPDSSKDQGVRLSRSGLFLGLSADGW